VKSTVLGHSSVGESHGGSVFRDCRFDFRDLMWDGLSAYFVLSIDLLGRVRSPWVEIYVPFRLNRNCVTLSKIMLIGTTHIGEIVTNIAPNNA